MAKSRKRIRYAVVGLGHIAQSAVLPAFAHAHATSELTALVSGDDTKLQVLGERYGVSHRFSYDAFAESLSLVDAVYICTPNTLHAQYAIEAARAGVHVLCEKPLAATSHDCDRMLAARDAGGVKFMTAYRLHFEPTTLEVLELVRSGRLGDIRYFSSSFSLQAAPGGIRTDPEMGGGATWDIGIYCINAARMLFGSAPVEAAAFSVKGTRSKMPAVDETTAALLRFEGGRLAAFTCSFDAADLSSYRIVGTKGQIMVDPAYEIAEALNYTMRIGSTTTRKKGRRVDQFAAELAYFSRCILDDVRPEPSLEEGAWDVRVIEALYESARQGAAVPLRPVAEPGPRPAQATSMPPSSEPPLVDVASPHE
jgi:glucose-fructose oxidoreductase